MKRFASITRLGALALLAGSIACSDGTSPATGSGHLSLVLKDAPGDVVAAVVTISEINLQGNGGKTVLSSTPVTTNLLTLASDADTLLDRVVVPAGSYSQLRFVITGGYIEVDNGDGSTSIYASSPSYAGLPVGATVTGSLQMPSMGQSGLKVTLPGTRLMVADGGATILVVDFDVAQSFGHQAGGSGMWVMHPVIRGGDIALTGSAAVNLALGSTITLPIINAVQLTLGDFSATFTGSDGIPRPASFSDSDGDGVYTALLLYVAPGDFTVDITPPVGLTVFTTTPVLPVSVTVNANATTTATVTVTGAS
ncbi:MAG: DUF4382 domain-containing protein [Gemmatimonadota bacterium]|mgnify:CR=1 FL=1|nr:DUF4382 domain-containing protein [Gemmatimonadota bacterium]